MQLAARTLLECQLGSIRPKHDAHAWQHWHPDHGAGLQVLPPGMSQELLQACMGSSRMSCQLIFLMTLSNYASRHCWARYVQQHSHVMSAQWCSAQCKCLFSGLETVVQHTPLPVSAIIYAEAMHARI